MSLAQRISDLASRLGNELKTRIGANHPGVAQAWVSFGWNNNQLVIGAAYNVAQVTRLAVGKYRISFATALADANYCWLAFARSPGNSGTVRTALARLTADAKTAQYVEVVCATANYALADSSEVNLVVYR